MITREKINLLNPVKPLGEVVEFLDNLRVPIKESERNPGKYPYYGANGQQGTIDKFIFDEPLLLLAEDGGFFGDPNKSIAYKINGKCWVNNHAHVLRPKNGNDLDFLFYQLKTYDVTPFINGTTRGKLTRGAADQIPIYAPEFDKQIKISTLLNKAAAIIQKRKETIKLADEFLRSTFLEMFGDPYTNERKWDIKTIEEVCEEIVDCPHSTPNYENTKTEYPCVRTTDLRNGYIDWSQMKYLNKEEYFLRTKRLIPIEGDVIFGREGNFGEAIRVPPNTKISLGQRTMLFRPNAVLVTSTFLWFILNSQSIYYQAKRISSGSTVLHINVGEIKKFFTIVPPMNKQIKYGRVLNKVELLKSKYEVSISEMENQFNSLMQRAFRGEL